MRINAEVRTDRHRGFSQVVTWPDLRADALADLARLVVLDCGAAAQKFGLDCHPHAGGND